MSEEKRLEFGQWVSYDSNNYRRGIVTGNAGYPMGLYRVEDSKGRGYHFASRNELTPIPSPNQLSDAEKVREVALMANAMPWVRKYHMSFLTTMMKEVEQRDKPKPTLLEAAKAVTDYYNGYGPVMPHELRDNLALAIAREEAKSNA